MPIGCQASLGEQSGRHPAMILDPVRASVSVVTGVAGRCQRLLLGFEILSAAGSYGTGLGHLHPHDRRDARAHDRAAVLLPMLGVEWPNL